MSLFPEFNSVRLIEEVKKRPGLHSAEHPADREEKLVLWKEIGASMFQDWDQVNKATAYDRVLQLQRKWRSLRDAYNRELRSRRSGVRVNKRTYMYFKRMSFLGGFDGEISDDEEVDTGPETFQESITDGDPLTNVTVPILPAIKKTKKRRSRKRDSDEVDLPMFTHDENEDSDKLFLLAFLPEMRQLPVNIKMWARAQIASIMQEAVTCHYSNTMPGGLEIKRQRRDSSD